MKMKHFYVATVAVLLWLGFSLSSCAVQDEKVATAPPPAPSAVAKTPAEEKAPAKAKVEKAKGDVGLIDTEKSYMILVTKEGKLVTLDFDEKTKVTKRTPTPSKLGDIGLGTSATVTYVNQNNKNVANSVEYQTKK
jgi:hypothetical protein